MMLCLKTTWDRGTVVISDLEFDALICTARSVEYDPPAVWRCIGRDGDIYNLSTKEVDRQQLN